MQRDLLPIIEGSQVSTKFGNVSTDHILFICSGAFHQCKPSDMLAELQGRLPIRVELKGLTCAPSKTLLFCAHGQCLACPGWLQCLELVGLGGRRRLLSVSRSSLVVCSADAGSVTCTRTDWRLHVCCSCMQTVCVGHVPFEGRHVLLWAYV